MTTPTITNTAQDDATVGIQTGFVLGDIYYQLPPNPSPEQTFRLGVKYLQSRMPVVARNHIEEAVARGYETHEVQFHRLLALLSGRTLRQLGVEDLRSLSAICGRIVWPGRDDAWTSGLRAVLRLIDSLKTAETDLMTKELDELPPQQRNMILDHLGVLLEGAMEDQMWHRSVERATAGRFAGSRQDRVWIFFEPEPAHPRVRSVRPADIPILVKVSAGIGTAAFVLATANLGRLVLRQPGHPTAILAYVVAAVGIAVWVINGAEWHFRRTRMRTKDAELIPPHQGTRKAPSDGFTSKVDQYLGKYFGRYVPRDTSPSYWLEQTVGIRRHLRDELAEIYREQRTDADQIAWLIRHLVSDVRSRWERGTLTAYRAELRTPLRMRFGCVAGLVVAIAGGLWVAPVAVLAAPAAGTVSILLSVSGCVIGARAWFRINSERRRVEADQIEHDRQRAARQAAFDRWRQKLSRRPSDAEMASWLECDRRLLVNDAMGHYRLKPSHVVAHAFIQAPGTPNKHTRIKSGPWRYTKYRLLLFLLTDDGVRQVDIDLDFEHCVGQVTQRLNYRFDAVAAVRVDGVATQRQTFELTLVNGRPIQVPVTESTTEAIQPQENPEDISRVTLDASGLSGTLNVLEGIAAEGKEWIKHQRSRADVRLTELTATISDLLD
jgi:hypothetical protein